MAFTSLEANKESLQRARDAAVDARKALSNGAPAYKRVAVFLDQWVQQNIASDGGKVGGWVPFTYGGRLAVNKPRSRGGKYIARPPVTPNAYIDGRYVNTSAKLLRDTGHLRLSMLPFSTQNKAGIGSALPYSKSHDEGIGTPQRRILPKEDDEEVMTGINQILEDWVIVSTGAKQR